MVSLRYLPSLAVLGSSGRLGYDGDIPESSGPAQVATSDFG
jgi:hypothetical protein